MARPFKVGDILKNKANRTLMKVLDIVDDGDYIVRWLDGSLCNDRMSNQLAHAQLTDRPDSYSLERNVIQNVHSAVFLHRDGAVDARQLENLILDEMKILLAYIAEVEYAVNNNRAIRPWHEVKAEAQCPVVRLYKEKSKAAT